MCKLFVRHCPLHVHKDTTHPQQRHYKLGVNRQSSYCPRHSRLENPRYFPRPASSARACSTSRLRSPKTSAASRMKRHFFPTESSATIRLWGNAKASTSAGNPPPEPTSTMLRTLRRGSTSNRDKESKKWFRSISPGAV